MILNQYRELNQNLLTVLTASKERTEAYVPAKFIGTVVSAVARYHRYIEKQKSDELTKDIPKREPGFVGVVGGAIGDVSKKVRQKMEQAGHSVNFDQFPYNGPIEVIVDKQPSAHSSAFGTSYRYSFVDKNGDKYTYFSSRDLDLKQGDRAKIVLASVKGHESKYGVSTLIGGNSPVKTVIEPI